MTNYILHVFCCEGLSVSDRERRMSLQSVRQFLAQHAPDIEIIELNQSTATVDLAAKAHHVEPGQIAKTLSLKVKNDIMEVDLHAHELLDTTAGMSNSEILNYQLDVFRKTLEECKNKKGQKIVFIHGKGDGVLRKAILQELKYKYKNYESQDASFREYGFGATMVIIH